MSYLIPAIPIINKWNKVNKSLYPKTNCTAIVLFNSKLDSTLVPAPVPRSEAPQGAEKLMAN